MDLYRVEPTPKKVVSFSLDTALINDFRSYCTKRKINMSYIIREAIRRFLINARVKETTE